ncbi:MULTISPECIES: RcpC/CpaB family pilus assembly protein [unclassified Streptomyces]|uniref:RcpC/CpaB family pilus assembly protein n=1 Tax=unclassified Streptomyces TaxID=2593676 RepID=UPI00344BABC5
MSPSLFPAATTHPARHTSAAPQRAATPAKPPPPPPAPPPAPCGVGPFAPLRVRGGGVYRLRRLLRRQHRAAAAGIALAGAALATTSLGGSEGRFAVPDATLSDSAVSNSAVSNSGISNSGISNSAGSDSGISDSEISDSGAEPGRPSMRLVSAPVRIADAATVRLLRPGDRVDVIAVGEAGDDARVVARDVRVTQVPGPAAEGDARRIGGPGTIGADAAPEGALVMLSVERSTATALLGAGVSGRLAVAVSDEN